MRRLPTPLAIILAAALAAAVAPATPAQAAAPANPDAAPTGSPLSQNAALQYWLAFSLLPQPGTPLHAAVSDWDKAPLGPELNDLAASPALRHLHRGAELATCDWGLHIDEDGPATMLPHFGKGRELARLGLLRARWNFENGRPAAALSDGRDVLVLSRHFAGEGFVIGYLVQVAIETQTLDLLGRQFKTLGPEDVTALDKLWTGLPAGVSLKQALAMEPRMTASWLRTLTEKTDRAKRMAKLQELGQEVTPEMAALVRDDTQLSAAIAEWRRMNAELMQICDLPVSAQSAAAAAFEARVARSGNPLVKLGLAPLGKIHATAVKVAVCRAMLRAAIAYRQGGAAAAKQVPDPATDQPFTLHEQADAFTLESTYQYKGKPVTREFTK